MDENFHPLIAGCAELQFRVQFNQDGSGLGWGRGDLFVAGERIWFQQDLSGDPTPVLWTWIDLLYFLGRNWAFLMYEETYPIGLTPVDPRALRSAAEQRWGQGMERAQVWDEDEAIFRFERRHDLATGLKGISLPSVTIVREGQLAWVCTSESSHRMNFNVVIKALEEIGELIANEVQNASTSRSVQALQCWRNRQHVTQEKLIRLRTGLRDLEINELMGDRNPAAYWEIEAASNDSELLAAARLSAGSVSLQSQKQMIEAVRRQPLCQTPELNRLTEQCSELLSKTEGLPFEQGYVVADWLRGQYPIQDRFDPETLLKDLGVQIDSIALPNCPLEAVACWGRHHGPAIILNVDGSMISASHGRRTTLAHELGHLLMDREGSLPLVEVLGGRTPEWIEKRARAFAAELLLPRRLAENSLDQVDTSDTENIERCIENLSRTFEVSRALVTHVLWNAGTRNKLSSSAYQHLEMLHRVASKPWSVRR